MASFVTITSITGTSPYNIYVCNSLGGSCVYVATTSSAPVTIQLPSIFDFAPLVTIKIVDSELCETSRLYNCTIIPTATPTPTPTNTPTPTSTPTPTPTPTLINGGYAYLLIEPYSARTTFNSWMSSQGSTWRGFNINSPSTNQATFESQIIDYINYPGWGSASPSIRKSFVSYSSGGFDAYSNPIEAYVFQTHEVPSTVLNGNEFAWYTWLVETGLTNGQKYSTIGVSTNGSSSALSEKYLEPTYYELTVNYSGSTEIPAGVYRVYTTYVNSEFKIQNLNNNIYFRGGNLIP